MVWQMENGAAAKYTKYANGIFCGSWSALAERSGDSAFERAEDLWNYKTHRAGESGVALRLPPQSKIFCA